MILTPPQSSKSRSFWRSEIMLPAALFLLGLGLAAAAALLWQDDLTDHAGIEFELSTQRVSTEVEQRFRKPIYGLNGLKSVYATHHKVKRANFRAAVEARKLPKEFPGVRGFGFIAQVKRTNLAPFVADERADGAPDFAIRQLVDKQKSDLFVIKFIEPAHANLDARGLDIGSEEARRNAAQQAVDTGEPAMTKAITLVQDGQNSPGVLILVPAYAQDADVRTVPERRAALLGLLYAPVVIRELLEGMNTVATNHLNFQLYQTDPDNTLLFTTNKYEPPAGVVQASAPEPRFVRNQTIAIAGQELTLRMTSTPEFDADIDHITPWLLLAAGALLSATLAFVIRYYIKDQHRAELLAEIKQAEAALAREVAHRAAAERIANNWLRLQSAALDVCANALLIVGVDEVIQWVNPAFCQLSGYTEAEAVGNRARDLVKSGAQDAAFYKNLWQTVLSGRPWKGELINRRKDGSRYCEHMTITPVCDAPGQVTHFIVLKEDITDRKKSEREAHAANRAKSEFLANMSHEIRTPMNGVIGMVDVLQQSRLDSDQSRMLDTIQQSSLVLLHILNDILDFSKIEAGKLTIECIPVHLRELLEDVAQLMVAACNAKSVALTLFVSPMLPHSIMTDPTRLRQVLLNLLGNAVKFTSSHFGKPAKVMLLVEPCTLAQGQAGVKLRVIDTGIGISPEVLVKLFQPFMQADAGTARKFGGTGLGLSISQRLTELLGGRISVRSALGEGSEFWVELPLQALVPAQIPVLGPSLLGVQVLALIGDAELSNIVQSYCIHANAKMTVLSSLEALHQHLQYVARPTEPTVLVLGLESTIALAALNLPAGVGVVQLLPCGKKMVVNPGTVCSNPLLYNDLIGAIVQASGQRSLTNTLHITRTDTLLSRPAPSVVQAQILGQLVLLADDNETNREVMTEQLRLLGYACEVAEDGVQALAMWRTGRYALLLTDCHMPHMDGFALTEAIRKAEPAGARFPVVAVTANAMQGEAERCREHGMDDYLTKPLRMVELAPMLQKWLPLAPADLAAPAAPLPDWNASTLSQMVGDNPALHRRLQDKFLEIAEKQVGAIVLSIDTGDFSAAADVAYALKSGARTVGALHLGALCEQIETAGRAGDDPACGLLRQGLEQALEQVRLSSTSAIHGA